MKWLNEKLCSFDEKVRIELGPQIIELECTKENLDNNVTHANYFLGGADAYGDVIGDSKNMNCIDWDAKHAPHLWKIYKLQDGVFVKVDEVESKQKAIKQAKLILQGMK